MRKQELDSSLKCSYFPAIINGCYITCVQGCPPVSEGSPTGAFVLLKFIWLILRQPD